MKIHLYGLHPSIWEVVVVDVTLPKNGISMAEQAQDYFRNAQAVRVITGSLCAQEFNKVWSVEIAKVIWDTLKEAHEGTDQAKKEDSSEEGSTDKETAFAIRNYKKFLKKKAFKNSGDDRKKTSQWRCYKCKEVSHFIADCPHKKKKEIEEKRFKDKSKDYKKKYQGQAHVGQEWDSSNEEDNKEGVDAENQPMTLGVGHTTRENLLNSCSGDRPGAVRVACQSI
ncbi:hypothetical protein SETIT_3G309100v2 [Setaria italica]|uniref:CCHC-type domain-containing protein n=1 Tax=Setaria italica TaxID=4555 RepID=A0A368QKY0_SETIT|nr:hypothetical protein SETIT_3G309100v2 [Setaria italica]